MLGNSSSGIIEAPSLALPAVNIGWRQEGRERAANIIDVPAERIVEVLSTTVLGEALLHKRPVSLD